MEPSKKPNAPATSSEGLAIPTIAFGTVAFWAWPYLIPLLARGYPAAGVLWEAVGALLAGGASFLWAKNMRHEHPVPYVVVTLAAMAGCLVLASLFLPGSFATIVAAAAFAGFATVAPKI